MPDFTQEELAQIAGALGRINSPVDMVLYNKVCAMLTPEGSKLGAEFYNKLSFSPVHAFEPVPSLAFTSKA